MIEVAPNKDAKFVGIKQKFQTPYAQIMTVNTLLSQQLSVEKCTTLM
jgi:hypothetical protein